MGSQGGLEGDWISLDKPWISKDDHFQKESNISGCSVI